MTLLLDRYLEDDWTRAASDCQWSSEHARSHLLIPEEIVPGYCNEMSSCTTLSAARCASAYEGKEMYEGLYKPQGTDITFLS